MGEGHPHSSKGMAYIVVAIEYLTKWTEAKVVKTDTTAHAATFMYENFILRFGCPITLVSDKGTHLLNYLIQKMTDNFQINHRKNTPYYLPTVEHRVNRILVRKTILDSKRDWDVKLIVALWAYRITFKVTT